MPKRTLESDSEKDAEINLSPMIDCIFILLIFFIVTTVFVEEPAVDVMKPDATVDQDLEKNSLIIAVTAEGKIVYGGKELSLASVGARVRQIVSKDDLPVIIEADSRVDHGVFSDVWTEVKNAGAKKISLATRND